MYITNNLDVKKTKHDGRILVCINGVWSDVTNSTCRNKYEEILKTKKRKKLSDIEKDFIISKLLSQINSEKLKDAANNTTAVDTETVKLALDKMIKFFTEFDFEPSFRFTNTLCNISNKDKSQAKQYIISYFDLSDKLSTELSDKLNSREFENILDVLSKSKPQKQINTRLKIYYGPQGTGKTTAMLNEVKKTMVCHSAMLPSDLMEDFEFVDGKAIFKPSALQLAMVKGEKIGLDEINLLPFESLRFMQSITDGKKSFVYKNKVIEIKDGFEIIGTMNLRINGSIFALPEPIVDRASELKEFKLNADCLINAII